MARRKRRRSRPLGDFMPVCVATLFVGGRMSRASRPGRPAVVDPDRFRRGIDEIVSARFEGFTVVEGKGFWEGTGEPSAVIQMMRPTTGDDCGNMATAVACTAAEIARAFDQDAVGVMVRRPDGKAEVDFVGSNYAGACPRADRSEVRKRIRKIRGAL